MFYNVLGAFAQFYREQLAENVSMGMAQAMHQGRWVNRPPTGYDLRDGILVPNADAATIRRVFKMRGEGASQGDIADATGIKYSTVRSFLHNRAYLGEIRHKDEWLPGAHDPLVTAEEFEAAHRGRVPGRRRGRDLMAGRVICGLCGRHMCLDTNGKGQRHYRCKHRGKGCKITARSNRGLLDAAALGLTLLCDAELQVAIREHLEARRGKARQGRTRRAPGASDRLASLHEQRRKLLALHYEDKISADQFGEEQARLTIEIENLESEVHDQVAEQVTSVDLAERFEQVTALLADLDIGTLWEAANETERRTLLDELLDRVTVHPDRLVVAIHGAPALNVGFAEVGLKEAPDSAIGGVGGGT